jgi:hypothetical protein
MAACSAAKLTCASDMPFSFLTVRSMFMAQLAHVMPVTGKVILSLDIFYPEKLYGSVYQFKAF